MPKEVACALVTGASKGIGRAIAIQLAVDHKLHILLNYARDSEAARETIALVEAAGGSAELLAFDVRDKAEVEKLIENWESSRPNCFIQVLVNNAGISRDGLLMWMSEEDWDDVIHTSVKGLYNVTQKVLRSMLRKRYGRIINISSLSGLKGHPGQTNYSAAKAAIIGASKALAQEIGKRNITVNVVAPGFIQSQMTENLDMEPYLSAIPLGRIGQAEEVAHLVSFLASEKASYISGEVININGGLYS